MYTTLSVLFFFCALTLVASDVTYSKAAGYDSATATYRACTVVSTADGFVITGVKASVANQQAKVDAAKFAVGNGQAGLSSNNPGFYLGVLDATAAGSIDTSKGAWSGSVTGAFAEVAASFNSILAYYEGNNVDGFQYQLGTDPTQGCADKTNTVDCVFAGDVIELKTLSWSSVNHVVTPCPNVDTACNVHSFYMTGSKSAIPVVKLNFTVTTHPILVTTTGGFSVEINPDKGKIDVDIMYPWASKTATTRTDAPHVALIVYAAGKAGVGAAAFSGVGRSVAWVGTTGKVTTFEWDGNAKVDGANAGVVVDIHTGEQIAAYDNNNSVGWGKLFVPLLQTAVALYKGFGWGTEMVIFSWTQNQPQIVSWDPALGSTSDSSVLGFSLVVMTAALLYHRFF